MTLRVRLILTFVLVVLVPMLVGAFLVSTYFPRVSRDEAIERVGGQRDAAAALVQQLCERARAAAEQLGPSVNTPEAASVAKSLVERNLADVVRVEDAQGRVLVSAGGVPGAAAGARMRDCRNGSDGMPNVIASRLTVQAKGQPDRYAEAGLVLDQDLVTRLARVVHADLTFVANGRAVVSSLDADGARQAARLAAGALERPRVLDDRLVAAQDSAPFVPTGFVLTADPPRNSSTVVKVLLPLLAACVLLALVFARQLARVTTLPLAELSDAAERVAGGDLGVRIPVRRRDEIGRLGTSFNAMTEQLRAKVDALQDSRDELRRNVARLGDTLSSTHDLTRILEVILDTAMASTGAQAGAVLLTAHGRGDLYLKVGRGLEERGITDTFRVRIGQGVSGSVAASGEPLRGRPGNRPGDLRPTADEPHADNVISVPFRSTGRVLGVLNLYDRVDAVEFDEADLVTIRTFASQAAVAVDNVLLHQEAQRLSITDGLTGVPNYRYFTINFAREIERAARFRRPLALLMLDIDHFKSVNDSYGHQRGDTVLVELAARVRAEIREVDMLARYGGEEFVLVLPETDQQGAELTAERICDVIRHRPFDNDDSPLTVTISIGVAVFPEHGSTAATLLRRADEALYVAKADGRDRWRVAAPEEPPPAVPAVPAASDGAGGGNGAVESPRPVGTGRAPRDG